MVDTRQAVELLMCLELVRVPAPALISLICPSYAGGDLFGTACIYICRCMPRFRLLHSKFRVSYPLKARFSSFYTRSPFGAIGLCLNLGEFFTHVPYSEPSRAGSPYRSILAAQNIRCTNAPTQYYLNPQQAKHEITNYNTH